jgi:flagellar hook-length control protein FliK
MNIATGAAAATTAAPAATLAGPPADEASPGTAGPIDFAALLLALAPEATAGAPALPATEAAIGDAAGEAGAETDANGSAADPLIALLAPDARRPVPAGDAGPARAGKAAAATAAVTATTDPPGIATGKSGGSDGMTAKLAETLPGTAADPAGGRARELALQNDAEGIHAPQAGAQASLQAATPNRAAAALAHVQSPVGNPAWAGELGQRLVWLASNGAQSAQITLNPAHLGPIEIRLNLSGGEATAIFLSPHGDVREALESALPRLREMFAAAGIDLGQAQVGSQSAGREGGAGESEAAAVPPAQASLGEAAADNMAGAQIRPLARGLVDTFA